MMKYTLIFLLCLSIIGCKKNKQPAGPEPSPSPSKSTLSFPYKDEVCTNGNVVSATESSIVFKWAASENTESYELNIKNLESGVNLLQTTTRTELGVTLLRNQPYSWSVTSKSSKTSAVTQSEVWKFYNPGPGLTFYSPFPAELTAPVFAQSVAATSGKITLDWNGSDADNDIATYDVYFGTTTSPPVFTTNLTESILNDVSVTGNTTYYWKVLTRDTKGNTSNSETYWFKVN